MSKSRLAAMREKMAEQEAMTSKPQELTTSQPSKSEASQLDKATASQGDEAVAAVPAPDPVEREAVAEIEAVKPSEPVEPQEAREPASSGRKAKASPKSVAKVEKRSTSLYLTPAALKALNVLAANQGVRPHRLIDDGLKHVFKKHGLDFDALNATD